MQRRRSGAESTPLPSVCSPPSALLLLVAVSRSERDPSLFGLVWMRFLFTRAPPHHFFPPPPHLIHLNNHASATATRSSASTHSTPRISLIPHDHTHRCFQPLRWPSSSISSNQLTQPSSLRSLVRFGFRKLHEIPRRKSEISAAPIYLERPSNSAQNYRPEMKHR